MQLDAIKRFFTSAHVLHMEAEIAQLRGQNAMLHLELLGALKPSAPAQVVRRETLKFTPVQTSWEAYRAEQIRLQEVEDADGTHSSGRV